MKKNLFLILPVLLFTLNSCNDEIVITLESTKMIFEDGTYNFDHLEKLESPNYVKFNYQKNYIFAKEDYNNISYYINENIFTSNYYQNMYCVVDQPGGEARNLGFFEDLSMTKNITSYINTTLTKDLHFYFCIMATGAFCSKRY